MTRLSNCHEDTKTLSNTKKSFVNLRAVVSWWLNCRVAIGTYKRATQAKLNSSARAGYKIKKPHVSKASILYSNFYILYSDFSLIPRLLQQIIKSLSCYLSHVRNIIHFVCTCIQFFLCFTEGFKC